MFYLELRKTKYRNRLMTFSALMRQECSWFDDKNHSPAALSARLTDDADKLQAVKTT